MDLFIPLIHLVKNKTRLIIRIILSLAFLGHGLVSLQLSPSYALHFNLIDSINITNIATSKIVQFHAYIDILISILLFFNLKIRWLLYFILTYLVFICIVALVFYWKQTGSIFGISECLRRFPWILFSLFIISDINKMPKYHFIRIGLSFAFIAHGFASLGFLGLNQAHIDLANNIVSSENARTFITYTGITDTIIGLMLLQSIFTKFITFIGILWISFIVYLSYLTALPDAIFRMGFLLSAIYVYLDQRTYLPKLITYEKK